MQRRFHNSIFLPYLILLCVLMLESRGAEAQRNDSLLNRLISLNSLQNMSWDSLKPKSDSGLYKQPTGKMGLPNNGFRKINRLPADGLSDSLYRKYFPGKPVLAFKGGYVNYNFTYRSNIDTPFIQNDVEQNLINAGADIMLSDKFPLRVSLAARRANSPYFRNYTYVNVQLNTSEFRKLQAVRLRSYFNELADQLMDPNLKSLMATQENRWKNLNGILNQPDIVKHFLQSKEKIINQDDLSDNNGQKDSILKEAKKFVELYEYRQNELKGVEKQYDSLRNTYTQTYREIQQLKQVFNKNINSPEGSEIISKSMHEAKLEDPRFDKMTGDLYAIRTFAVGQTLPDYTSLTVKNIGVNGLNVEYNKNNLYTAVVAGLVNFEAMNFIMTGGSPSRQYLGAARIGWGRKEGDHIIYTLYGGKKQIFSSQTMNNVASVMGMSIEAQWLLTRNIRLTGEIAQSALQPTPYILTDTTKKRFSLSNSSNQAWSVHLNSFFPVTKTRVEGFYEYQGINFQCFNAYKVNANFNAWNLKADQYLFSGMLHITAAVQKNDYVNPLVLQNYNSNTVFVTSAVSFHKPYWPAISIGYIPSSQYSILNNITYESRYQALNINLNHSYSLGSARAITTLMYNRFYNSSYDSGFVYYNAHNLYASQNFIFTAYAAHISISHTQNPTYILDVMDAGFTKNIKKNNNLGFGLKLNHLNNNENKIGYYISGRANIPEVGVLTVSGEKSYLPGMGDVLVNCEFFNIGFTRYFK